MLELLCIDSEVRAVLMTLGSCRRLGYLFPMGTVCTLLFGVMYLLQPRLQFFFVLCRPGVSWWSVSYLIQEGLK